MIKTVHIGSTLLTNDQRFCTAIRNLAMADIFTSEATKGGFSGRKVIMGKPQGYTFITEWGIIGTDFSDLAQQRQEFMSLLSEIIDDGEANIIFTRSDDVQLLLNVKSVKVTGDISAQDGNLSRFLVEMKTDYPFLQSNSQKSENISIFAGGGWAIPFGIPFDMSAGSVTDVSVENEGNYRAYPILRIYGELSNPVITNTTTGEVMNVSGDLATAADYLEIDTFKRTVLLYPAGSNARSMVSGDFITLQKGINNIRLSNGSSTDGKLVLSFRDHYVGI